MPASEIAAYLHTAHPDCAAACDLLTTLFANASGRRVLNMASAVIPPLVSLLRELPAASRPLATAGRMLWRVDAYPEARACLEAVLPLPPDSLGLDRGWVVPWDNLSGEREFVQGAREQALLTLYYSECLLAAGEAAEGQAAFALACERAQRAELPSYIQLSPVISECGTLDDFRLYALTRAARALRLRLLGRDACVWRKLSKSQRVPSSDPRLLQTASGYAEAALAMVAARAPQQYAGLVPDTVYSRELTRTQRNYHWQWETYLEAGLLDEMNGVMDRAKVRVGQARFLAALDDPSNTYRLELLEAIARLGAECTPL